MVEGLERRARSGSRISRLLLATLRRPLLQWNAVRAQRPYRAIGSLVDQYVRRQRSWRTPRPHNRFENDDPRGLCDTIASNLKISVEDKQGCSRSSRCRTGCRLIEVLEVELEKIQVDRAIHGRVKRQMDRAQKEYYSREDQGDPQGTRTQDEKLSWKNSSRRSNRRESKAPRKGSAELRRLEQMPPIVRGKHSISQLSGWLLAVPWKEKTKRFATFKAAQEVLDGITRVEKVKERSSNTWPCASLSNASRVDSCFSDSRRGKTSLGGR